MKYATISKRCSMAVLFFKGKTTHFFINRAPIGEMVLSKISSKDLPVSWFVCINSKFRIVNLSSQTYLSGSNLEMCKCRKFRFSFACK